MHEYKLIRSKRKTVAIHITKHGTVEVRAPKDVPKSYIDGIVCEKDKWIEKHRLVMERRIEGKDKFRLSYGDTVMFLGEECSIIAKDGGHAGFDGECFYVPPGLSDNEIKAAIVRIYKMLAKQIMPQRVALFAQRMNVNPSSVKVNSAKTRWGSCSGKNAINFSWYLIMAPGNIVDYIVVHELAHITQHNHSERFWGIVESVIPDYKERQHELKLLQERLACEDWDLKKGAMDD